MKADELKALSDAATDGLWKAVSDPCHYDTVSDVIAGEVRSGRDAFGPVNQMHMSVGGFAGVAEQEANTKFVAAIVNAYRAGDLIPATPDAARQFLVADYDRRNPMRTADFHSTGCYCERCVIDALRTNEVPSLASWEGRSDGK